NKRMLNSSDIHKVVQMISEQKKTEYDSAYIEELDQIYNDHTYLDDASYEKLSDLVKEKEVILIGPGKSIITYQEQLDNYIDNSNCFVITINNPNLHKHNAVFYSNRKRYQESCDDLTPDDIKMITSNIS